MDVPRDGSGKRRRGGRRPGRGPRERALDDLATLAERARDIATAWQDRGFDIDFGQLFYAGERSHGVEYLAARGWNVTARNRLDVFADYGRTFPVDDTVVPMRRMDVLPG